MKCKISRHRGEPEDKRVGSEVASLWRPVGGPFAAHLCATQWMRGGSPPGDGCPPAACQRATGVMFVGL